MSGQVSTPVHSPNPLSKLESKDAGRVLVIDDEPMNIQVVTSVLSMSGFLVDSATDGRQALPRMRDFSPDAVLLDLMMPGRDGFELCRLIRVDPKLARISVIIVTGVQELEARHRGLSCGATDYMTKPWKPEDLVLRVRNAVELKRSSERLEVAYKEIDKLRNTVESLKTGAEALSGSVPLPS